MKIGAGALVSLDVTMYDAQGNMLERSEEPLVYLHGHDDVFPRVEQAQRLDVARRQMLVRQRRALDVPERRDEACHGVLDLAPARLLSKPPHQPVPLIRRRVGQEDALEEVTGCGKTKAGTRASAWSG